MNIWGKLPRWVVLLGIFGIGVILTAISKHFWEWASGIADDVGIALLVASVLGFTVDRWMKIDLTADAVQASLGHVLLPEFRSEVARIIGYKTICTKHTLLVHIEKVSSDVVRVTCSVERMVINRSSYDEDVKQFVHADEWGFKNHQSEILECGYELGNEREIAHSRARDDFTVRADVEKVAKLKPGKSVRLFSKWIEYRRNNDVLYLHFNVPTTNPEITVRPSQELDVQIGFGNPDPTVEPHQYEIRKQLQGTYFPHQLMSVRWWPKPTPSSNGRQRVA
jgi:hypothetical protein